MLTSDLVRVTVRKGEVRPRYLTEDEESLSLAEQLIELFTAHTGQPRHELDAELQELVGTGTQFLLHRGLAKLLRDRCTFEAHAPLDPGELREAVFTAAATAWRQPADQPAAEGIVAAGFHFDRDAVLATAAVGLELPADEIERGLYADLVDEQLLTRFEPCTPTWLLRRYNVALAQAVLLRATGLTIELGGGSPRQHRELFRKIKFFQLLHRVEGTAKAGYTIHLDGPLSLFQASGRYGLQMATFLPTLLHFKAWRLTAALRWGPRRVERTFTLSPDAGLVPHNRLTGQWQPEEVAWLPERFAKLKSDWTLSTDAALLDLGGQGVLIPDFVFTHRDGRTINMEILGYWRRGAVDSRLALLRRHGPANFLLGLSKQLAGGHEEDLDDLPVGVYLFRRHPIARQVLAALEDFPPTQ